MTFLSGEELKPEWRKEYDCILLYDPTVFGDHQREFR